MSNEARRAAGTINVKERRDYNTNRHCRLGRQGDNPAACRARLSEPGTASCARIYILYKQYARARFFCLSFCLYRHYMSVSLVNHCSLMLSAVVVALLLLVGVELNRGPPTGLRLGLSNARSALIQTLSSPTSLTFSSSLKRG